MWKKTKTHLKDKSSCGYYGVTAYLILNITVAKAKVKYN